MKNTSSLLNIILEFPKLNIIILLGIFITVLIQLLYFQNEKFFPSLSSSVGYVFMSFGFRLFLTATFGVLTNFPKNTLPRSTLFLLSISFLIMSLLFSYPILSKYVVG